MGSVSSREGAGPDGAFTADIAQPVKITEITADFQKAFMAFEAAQIFLPAEGSLGAVAKAIAAFTVY